MNLIRASLVAQLVKNPPAMPETKVQSLGQENPLEKATATHSSILTWRIPCHKESDLTEQLSLSLCMNPIQYKNINKNKAFSVQEDNLILKYVSVGIKLDK